jgi:hypothetical protein
MNRVEALLAEMEGRLASIARANGYETDLGKSLYPPGTFLEVEDAPCIGLFESIPDAQDGVSWLAAGKIDSDAVDFILPWTVQAYVPRGTEAPRPVAYRATRDILKALFSPANGQLANGGFNRLVRIGRGNMPKSSRIAVAIVQGEVAVTEDVYR